MMNIQLQNAGQSTDIESGLLNVFRLFVAVEAGAFLLVYGYSELAEARLMEQLQSRAYINLLFSILMLFYLSWAWLRKKLKQYYLPMALILATITPIISYNIQLYHDMENNTYIITGYVWQLTPLLFAPLVLTAWQYRFETVMLFCIFTGVLDFILILFSAQVFTQGFFPILGVIFIRTASFFVVGYMVTTLMDTQRKQRAALSQANLKLSQHAATLEQLGISRERNRLARELHDTLAHTLSGLAVQLEAMKITLPPEQNETHAILDQSLATVRHGLTDTRRALKDLRATNLDDLGLCLAIRNLAIHTASRADVFMEVDIPQKIDDLPANVEQAIYRIAQESLENITRHANAQNVNITLKKNNGIIYLTISDDGLGFDLQNVDYEERLGIKGMQERAAMIGGLLEVTSHPEKGTTISFTLEENNAPYFNL